MSSFGLTFPLVRASGSIGLFETTRTELSAVSQNIKQLVLTNWGERVMRYDYGCNLIEFLFRPATGEELKIMIKERITSQLARWLPFVTIDELEVILEEDDPSIPSNGIFVRMEYHMNGRPDLSAIFEEVVVS